MFPNIVRRLLMLIPVLLGVSLVVFSIVHIIPGDPARIMAGVDATGEEIELIRRQLDLDKPVYVQYFLWISKALSGDLGRSIVTNQAVLPEIIHRFSATLQLTLAAMILAVLIGVTVGVVSATKPYSLFDHLSMVAALFGVSMPIFWMGLMFIFLFSVTLGLFPSSGKDGIEHLVLPALTLGLASTGIIARMTRSSMLEVLGQDYVRTARAKGATEEDVVYRHALKNAMIPIVTIVGLQFGYLLSGAVLTETVFNWPGIGRLMVDSIFNRDFPMLQGAVLLVASSFVLVNLLTDLLCAYLDPRVKFE
jgi:peptide/nickel transport system permease protein